MKYLILFTIFIHLLLPLFGQHTFSIVAVDTETGEVGSAGATCLEDSPFTPGGALIISDVLPGKGVIHTQALWDPLNQANARLRMEAGDSPEEIIEWLIANDIDGDPSVRQYGITDFDSMGNARVAAHTGVNCFDFKDDITGLSYSIQGNILLGYNVLDQMEVGFFLTEGSLADKLMAGLQGANIVGADTRCNSIGKSSLSAFIRLAKPDDHPDSLFLDLSVGSTPFGLDPIDSLQSLFDEWKSNLPPDPTGISAPLANKTLFTLSPNPVRDIAKLEIAGNRAFNDYNIQLFDLQSNLIKEWDLKGEILLFNREAIDAGLYILRIMHKGKYMGGTKVIIQD